MTFPDEIRATRERLELSQRAAVEALAAHGVVISERTLGTYERGEGSEPSDKKKQTILAAYRKIANPEWHDELRPGYRTEADFWAERPREALEPAAPAGVVLAFIIEDSNGTPVWGYEPSGRVVQLGPAIRVRAGAVNSDAASKR